MQTALDIQAPALAAYFPRLCFLNAGLLAAGQALGNAREAIDLVRGATVANKTESLLARCWRKDAEAAQLKARTKDSRSGQYWQAWLTGTYRLGEGDPKTAERSAEVMGESAQTGAERALGLALRDMARRPTPLRLPRSSPARGPSAQAPADGGAGAGDR